MDMFIYFQIISNVPSSDFTLVLSGLLSLSDPASDFTVTGGGGAGNFVCEHIIYNLVE